GQSAQTNPPASAALGAVTGGGAYTAATNDYNAAAAGLKPSPIVVLIMAADPGSCAGVTTATLAAQALAAFTATPSGRAFVIGINLTDPLAAQTIATAGGGKGYNYTSGGIDTFVYTSLVNVRRNVLPCSVGLPGLSTFDPTLTVVQYSLP